MKNTYLVKELIKPDFAGYSEKSIGYVSGKNKAKAREKMRIGISSHYSLEKLPKKESSKVIEGFKKEFKDAKEILKIYKDSNSKSINRFIQDQEYLVKIAKIDYQRVKI